MDKGNESSHRVEKSEHQHDTSKRPAKKRNRGSGGGGGKDVRVSKSLSWVLRHAAPELKIEMGEDGYVALPDLISHTHPKLKDITEETVRKVVETNDKQRFSLCEREGVLHIRANQGHSIKTINPNLLLNPIPPAELTMLTIVHGTYKDPWMKHIRAEGLSRMNRTHIHFAPGMPGDDSVISGMRKSCDIYVHIDATRCAADGIEFWRSANQVILTGGLDNTGILPPKYFSFVVNKQGELLLDQRSPQAEMKPKSTTSHGSQDEESFDSEN